MEEVKKRRERAKRKLWKTYIIDIWCLFIGYNKKLLEKLLREKEKENKIKERKFKLRWWRRVKKESYRTDTRRKVENRPAQPWKT